MYLCGGGSTEDLLNDAIRLLNYIINTVTLLVKLQHVSWLQLALHTDCEEVGVCEYVCGGGTTCKEQLNPRIKGIIKGALYQEAPRVSGWIL